MEILILKRILFIFAAVILVAQIPFALGRYRTARLAAQIDEMKKTRRTTQDVGYRDLKGVIHVHSFAGGHSTGTYFELVEAARENSLDFVVMTEHATDLFDTSKRSLNGRHGETIWIGGNEISTADGDKFLVLEGFEGLSKLRKYPTNRFVSEIKERGKQALQIYPEKRFIKEADGVEVFSLHTNAKQMNPVLFLMDALWSYGAYPELTLARYFERPDENLDAYDSDRSESRTYLFAGNDAHSNIGLYIGDDANNRYLDLKYDRYKTIFRVVRTHVLIPSGEESDDKAILAALGRGNSYIGVDVLGDTTGFRFYGDTAEGSVLMGGEISPSGNSPNLVAETPFPSRLVLFRNGSRVIESDGSGSLVYKAERAGTYRVEAYLDSLGPPFDRIPWIISNPIYVR